VSIGQRIKEQRKESKLTQEELGNKMNVSSQVISNWERDYSNPDPNDIYWLSEILNVSTDYLLTGKELINETSLNEELVSWLNFGKKLKDKGYDLYDIETMINNITLTLGKLNNKE
jgi:transcriptional regulator with XRE-family HTH domain